MFERRASIVKLLAYRLQHNRFTIERLAWTRLVAFSKFSIFCCLQSVCLPPWLYFTNARLLYVQLMFSIMPGGLTIGDCWMGSKQVHSIYPFRGSSVVSRDEFHVVRLPLCFLIILSICSLTGEYSFTSGHGIANLFFGVYATPRIILPQLFC